MKMQVRKTQVQICRGGKRKYGNGKSDHDADMTDRKISTDEYEWDDGDESRRSPVAASSNTTVWATVVKASCDVCLNAPRVKVSLVYHVDMQLYVVSVRHSEGFSPHKPD